jgi:hypothetical protein
MPRWLYSQTKFEKGFKKKSFNFYSEIKINYTGRERLKSVTRSDFLLCLRAIALLCNDAATSFIRL